MNNKNHIAENLSKYTDNFLPKEINTLLPITWVVENPTENILGKSCFYNFTP